MKLRTLTFSFDDGPEPDGSAVPTTTAAGQCEIFRTVIDAVAAGGGRDPRDEVPRLVRGLRRQRLRFVDEVRTSGALDPYTQGGGSGRA
jgi:hypothetical protein